MGHVVDNREELIRFIDEANNKLWALINAPLDFDPEKLCHEVIAKSELAEYPFGKAFCLLNAGRGSFIIQHNVEMALGLVSQALEIFRKIDAKKWIANTLLVQGIIHNTAGNREAAMYSVLRGIDFYETHPQEACDWEMAYYFIGPVYKDLGKLQEAEILYLKGLSKNKRGAEVWTGRLQTSLSGIYASEGKYSEALEIGQKALLTFREENNFVAESRALTDMGVIHKKMGNHDKALDYFLQGLEMREKHHVKQFILTSLLEISALYSETGKAVEAITYLKRAELLAKDIRALAKLCNIYQQIALTYKCLDAYKEALAYYEKFLELTLELHAADSEKRIKDLHSDLLNEKEQEIERLKNVELKEAYQVISEKQKEILDSIQYAKRIQQSLLPNEKFIDKLLKQARNS